MKILLLLTSLALATSMVPDRVPFMSHWLGDIWGTRGHLRMEPRDIVQLTSVAPGGDFICGVNASSDPNVRNNKTLTIGYAHPLAMKNGARDDALLFSQMPENRDWCFQTTPTGVLEPREMWKWKDDQVPNVFQVYSVTIGRQWANGDIASLNDLLFAWQDSHGYVLQDDFQRAAYYELFLDSNWVGIPWLHSARSVTINTTRWQECNIPLPPPHNDTAFPPRPGSNPPDYTDSYGWVQFTQQMVGLSRCGVKKSLILEECMTHPWFMSILHSHRIKLFQGDRKTSGWRGEAFVQVIYAILWPILKEAAITDPNQSMVKQWINFASSIMQEYQNTPLSQWPASKPTPIPRSECNLATSVEGASSHYSGTRPEMSLADSPGTANSFQTWCWSKSGRPMPAHISSKADEFLRFQANYLDYSTTPPVPTAKYTSDLNRFNVPPLERVRSRPEFQALLTSQRSQINERLLRKGRALEYPNTPRKYTDQFEGYAIVSRFLHDLMFKLGLTPSNWDEPETVKAAIRTARDRAVTLIELTALPDCDLERDTVTRTETGAIRVLEFDPSKADKTCRVTEQATARLTASSMTRQPIPCEHPHDTLYVLDTGCKDDNSLEGQATARITWDLALVGQVCHVTNASWTSVPVNQRTVLLGCPYILDEGAATVLVLSFLALVWLIEGAYVFLLFRWRKAKSIAKSAWRWSVVLVISCMILGGSCLSELGPRTSTSCTSFPVWAPLGLTSALGALLVKLHRVRVIFLQRDLQVKKILDRNLILRYASVLGIHVLLLVVWVTTMNSVFTHTSLLLHPVAHRLVVTECSYGQNYVLALWLVFISLLLAYNLWTIFALRRAPQQFSEPLVLFWLSILIPLLCLISIPSLVYAANDRQRSIFKIVLSLATSLIVASVYVIPKLLDACFDFEGVHHQTRITLSTQTGAPKNSNEALFIRRPSGLHPSQLAPTPMPTSEYTVSTMGPVGRTTPSSPVMGGRPERSAGYHAESGGHSLGLQTESNKRKTAIHAQQLLTVPTEP